MDPDTSTSDGSKAFSPVTFSDHAGQLWIVTILSLIYSGLVALARAYIKYRMFGFDDVLFALATLFHFAQSISIFVGLNSSVSKFNSITTPEQWATSSKSVLASVIFFILSLSLAKCSALALILRIIGSKTGMSKPLCISLIILSAAWGVGSCLAFLVNCRADGLLTSNNVKQCPDQETRWAVITAIDIVTEIFTWLLVLQVSWNVNISFKRKFQVVLAFSFRIPLIAFAAGHLASFSTYPTATEPQFAVTNSLIWQQIMIAWSLISATVPNLKNFLKSFSIGMGFPVAFDLTMYGSSNRYASSNTYALQSLGKNRSATTSAAAAGSAVKSTSVSVHHQSESEARGRPHNWRPDQVSNQATVARHSGGNSQDNISEEGRSSRAGSQEMIINKQMAWEVKYEDHRQF